MFDSYTFPALVPTIDKSCKELSKVTISNWIKNVCSANCSSENAQLHTVHAHGVRALAASWALRPGFSLEDNMRACTWRNHTTFTRFYLKDSIYNDTGYIRLPAFVAAQSLINL